MAQTKYTCNDCVLLNDEDSEFPYCIWAKTYIHTQILTMMLAETSFHWYIRARIVSSSRMIFATIPQRRDIPRKKILLALVSSTKRL